ncbi:MAG: FAD-dependent oxidoreductase [Proteobacteria bacterium]|nr:FAD-dependent oxidoreductase [Pseudomonadota bacterium]
MGLSRRGLLQGLAAVSLAPLGCSRPTEALPTLTGTILGRELAERGHRIRGAAPRPWRPGVGESCDVAIVGGGVGGLSAAWRLARAGYTGKVMLLELGDTVGGTSSQASSAVGPHPLGAHYITLPNPGCTHVRHLLDELGVITGWSGGRPTYDERALCFAPQERVFAAGAWSPGLWPAVLSTPADDEQLADFDAHCTRWRDRRGADGRRAFDIPVHHSSRDPEITALVGRSWASYIAEQGWDSPMLGWFLQYGTLDDFGTTLEQTSAWAGLHYHCSRAPDAANDRDLGTRVLTWPGGNGRLVEGLAAAGRAEVRPGAVVRRVEQGRVTYEDPGFDGSYQLTAQHVILAVPRRVAARLLGADVGAQPDFAPWRVASLYVDRAPASRGLGTAWDSVIYGSDSLGYVNNSHQSGSYGGPAVLTWYQPLTDGDPRPLMAATWADEADRVLRDLARAHPDLRARVQRLDVMHWGHGTVRPLVGVDPLAPAPAVEGVSFAHTDGSGMSLFEEASWHGVRAAEEAMAGLGHDFGASWT